jgi:curved DNA-binding protein
MARTRQVYLDDHYMCLGVHRSATAREIHEAYLSMARECHPDVNPDDPDAVKNFRRIRVAFEVLSDSVERANYDRTAVSFSTLLAAKAPSAPAMTINICDCSEGYR